MAKVVTKVVSDCGSVGWHATGCFFSFLFLIISIIIIFGFWLVSFLEVVVVRCAVVSFGCQVNFTVDRTRGKA